MKKQNSPKSPFRPVLYCVLGALLIAALYGLRHDLKEALRVIASVSPGWIVLGVCLMLVSVACTSLVYHLLSPRPLRYRHTILLQTSGLFINKILPSGSGGLGLSYLYLRSNKLDKVSAAALVALNNTIGFLGHITLLLLVLGFDHRHVRVPDMHLPAHFVQYLLAAVVVVGLCLLILLVFKRKRGGAPFGSRQLRLILTGMKSPRRSVAALFVSMVLTLCYVGCLAIASQALDIRLTLPGLIIVLSVSVFATSIIPSPGGIGAAEAGMYVALRAYQVPVETALAAAILYRVMTFWIPLVLGLGAYILVEKSKIIRYKL